MKEFLSVPRNVVGILIVAVIIILVIVAIVNSQNNSNNDETDVSNPPSVSDVETEEDPGVNVAPEDSVDGNLPLPETGVSHY